MNIILFHLDTLNTIYNINEVFFQRNNIMVEDNDDLFVTRYW